MNAADRRKAGSILNQVNAVEVPAGASNKTRVKHEMTLTVGQWQFLSDKLGQLESGAEVE